MNITSKRLHRHKLPFGVLGAAVSTSGKDLYAACLDGVYTLDCESGDNRKLYEHKSYASGVVNLNDEMIASCGYDGRLQWFDTVSGSLRNDVKVHSSWSWDIAKSDDGKVVAVSCGQYLAGDYDYMPAASDEPCVQVFNGENGGTISKFDFGPPVQAVAVSPSGNYVAAGNLMGDVAVWKVGGQRLANWNTPDFTAFGIIKSHCQIGGIYAMAFTADERDLIVAGMGPMRDPMAGNGKQRWQRYRWLDDNALPKSSPEKVAEAKDDQVGEGLMETIAIDPAGRIFVMAGRLRGGAWNTGLFSLETGDLVHSLKTDKRVTKAVFSKDGSRLMLCGAVTQPQKVDQSFGIVDIYELEFSNLSSS